MSSVVHCLNGDKVIAWMTFSLVFYQSCWDVVKWDVLSVFNEFARHGKFVRSIRCLILCFGTISRLKVNLSKLEVIPIGCVGNVQ